MGNEGCKRHIVDEDYIGMSKHALDNEKTVDARWDLERPVCWIEGITKSVKHQSEQ